MNTIKHLLIISGLTFVLFSCNNTQETSVKESNLVTISNQQFITDSMQLGNIETRQFEKTIKCNGNIEPLPKGMAKVSAPLAGVIKNIYIQNGQFVNRNQPLLELTGVEIIDIQKDFAEASANYKRLKSEYERILSLYNEKVTSEKDFIVAETEFKTSKAKYNGLKLKIEAIGFSVAKIENGEFHSSCSIKSPIDGYISKLQTNIGTYIESQNELMEIINPEMFQIKLSIFAKDIATLKKGQTVRFKSLNTDDMYFATINSIGVTIENESKSINCYATVKDKNLSNLIVNEYIEAEIITNIDSVIALPSDAIIKSETENYILLLDSKDDSKYLFKKVEIKIGNQINGYTEILEPKIDGLILTNGIYNITL